MENEVPMYVRPYMEDPVWMQPDDSEVDLTYHNALENEVPMYVRPYLEDPIFLQPDDGEVA